MLPFPRARALLWQMVVTRNVILVGLGLSTIGFVLVRVALSLPSDWAATNELTKEIGSTMFGLGVIALVWELFARRAFMREVLDSVDLAEEVADAGLQRICWNYTQDIPWQRFFETSSNVDLFFSYAQTWRNTNYVHIEAFAAKKGNRLRVVLPDPDDLATMAELARRFDQTPDKVADLIRESAKYYTALPRKYPSGAAVECKYVPCCPLMAIYLFGESAVLTMSSHQRKRTQVPTLLVEAHRPVYDYLRAEFECLVALARPAP